MNRHREPWTVEDAPALNEEEAKRLQTTGGKLSGTAYVVKNCDGRLVFGRSWGREELPSKAVLLRMVACVNAMAGVDMGKAAKPANLASVFRRTLAVLSDYTDQGEYLSDVTPGPDVCKVCRQNRYGVSGHAPDCEIKKLHSEIEQLLTLLEKEGADIESDHENVSAS